MPVPTFKDNLMGALHTAVRYFNSGVGPNEAVVKAAQEHDFNSDQATRLVETFNTARTIYHYKSAADRTTPFALADSAAVIPLLFKQEQKKADVPATANHNYGDYDKPEADYRDGLEIKSAAGVRNIDIPEPRKFLDTSLNAQGIRAYEVLHMQRELAKAARDESRVAGAKASQILSKVAGDISRGYAEIQQDVYDRLVSGYLAHATAQTKEQWGPVIQKLGEFVPKWMQKNAEKVEDYVVVDDRKLEPYLELLKEAKGWMEAEAEMLAVASQMEKEANDFEREWTETIAPVLPKVPPKEASTLADFIDFRLLKVAQEQPEDTTTVTGQPTINAARGAKVLVNPVIPPKSEATGVKPLGGDKKPGEKKPSFLTEAVQKGIAEPVSGMTSAGLEESLRGMLSFPTKRENVQLSERLKNVQRQIMLQDLMTNDPVLSEENPETVAQAYHSVLSLAPELSINKEVVRAILRQAVHSVAISPYEAKVWTELEQSIRNIAGKTDIKGRSVEAGQEGRK
jgi:hypothetical protein